MFLHDWVHAIAHKSGLFQIFFFTGVLLGCAVRRMVQAGRGGTPGVLYGSPVGIALISIHYEFFSRGLVCTVSAHKRKMLRFRDLVTFFRLVGC